MREEELDIAIKVVIVGNGAVGKSSMIQRYCKGIFTKDYKKTIGVDFLERQIDVDGEDIRLMLWDTAGQEEFDAITKAYYRGAQACVVAFSLTDRKSYESVESWLLKVEDEVGEGVPSALVLNKMDLAGTGAEQVTPEEADDLAKRLRLPLYRTSVKNDLNISHVFHYLAEKYIEEINGTCDDDASPSPLLAKDDDPWNRPRETKTMDDLFRDPGEEVRPANAGVKTIVRVVGDEQFMAKETPSTTKTSDPHRHRWRFRKKKKDNNLTTASSMGGATIVLAPSKRRTKAKKENIFASSCVIL